MIRTLFIAITTSSLQESTHAYKFPVTNISMDIFRFLLIELMLLIQSHRAEIIIVTGLIKGRNNVTRERDMS